ncbi:MAG: ABC transporter permease [Treponema sp.]|nr:ABC transporter permease [Treponema sp.]
MFKRAAALGSPLALPGLILLFWGLAARFHLVNPYLIPSPGRVAATALQLLRGGELGRHIGVSLLRVAGGYGVSVFAALPLAFLFHQCPALKPWFQGVFAFLRAVPPLAVIPLLILWFGLGEASKRAVIVLATFFPVFLNALSGFDAIDRRWFELAESLELSFFRRLWYILLPGAFPHISAGLRLGFGYAWRSLLGAELFASASGLGYLISDAQEMARIDQAFVGIITIGAMGILFDALFHLAHRVFSRGQEDRTGGIDG